jgi:single-strand DNA-binding protein
MEAHMSQLNKVLLIGYVGTKPTIRRDRELITARLRISTAIATPEGTKTDWHDIVCHGKLAEVCEQYVEPGRLVYIEGKLTSHVWSTKDGDRFEREIEAVRLDMLSPRAAEVL